MMLPCVSQIRIGSHASCAQPRRAQRAAARVPTHTRKPADTKVFSRYVVAYSVSEPSKDGEEGVVDGKLPKQIGVDAQPVASAFAAPQAANAASTGDAESTATSTQTTPTSGSDGDLDTLKLQLLAAVSSLDRGIAANVREAAEVDALATELEAAGDAVLLEWKTSESSPDSSTMEKLGGTWRLIYSSGFNTGSLGGRRPGPPAVLVPLVLGQVYQRIDNDQGKLDNIVEFLFSSPLPSLPFLPSTAESPAVRLTLGHDFSVQAPNTVEIVYEDTAAQLQGTQLLDSFPRFAVPALPDFLRPPKFLRSATFRVTFLDALLRITRGDRGELRIYLKDEDLLDSAGPSAPADYVD